MSFLRFLIMFSLSLLVIITVGAALFYIVPVFIAILMSLGGILLLAPIFIIVIVFVVFALVAFLCGAWIFVGALLVFPFLAVFLVFLVLLLLPIFLFISFISFSDSDHHYVNFDIQNSYLSSTCCEDNTNSKIIIKRKNNYLAVVNGS